MPCRTPSPRRRTTTHLLSFFSFAHQGFSRFSQEHPHAFDFHLGRDWHWRHSSPWSLITAILKRHRKEYHRREECPLSTLVAYRIQDQKTWSRWSQVDRLWRERFDWPAGRIHGNQYTTWDSAKLPLVDRSVAGRIPQPAWISPVCMSHDHSTYITSSSHPSID